MWLPDHEQICLVRGPTYFYERKTLGPLTTYIIHIAQNLYKILPELHINISLALQHRAVVVVVVLKRPKTSRHVSSSKSLYKLERTQNRSSVSRDPTKIPHGHM